MQEKKQFYKKLAVLVLPIAVQNLMTALVSASDALMLGFLDQSSLSAVSLATQVQFVLNLFYRPEPVLCRAHHRVHCPCGAVLGEGGFPFCREDPRRRIEERPAHFCSVLLRSACGAGASHEDIHLRQRADPSGSGLSEGGELVLSVHGDITDLSVYHEEYRKSSAEHHIRFHSSCTEYRTECSADLRAYRIPADGDSGGCSCDNHLTCG